MYKSAFFVVCVLGLALAAPGEFQSVESNEIEQPGTWERMGRMMSSCFTSDEDITTCLGIKGAMALNRASRMKNIQIVDGIMLNSDGSTRSGKSLESENEITSQLPAEPRERSARALDILKDSFFDFLQSHSLQVKVAPEELSSAARAFSEARGKLKKMLGPILLGVAVKVLAFLTIFGGGLALLVTKALIVSKLALVLASILGFQKLLGSGGAGGIIPTKSSGWSNPGAATTGQWTTGGAANTWSNAASSAAGYPYARSIQTEAQEMAYAGQKQ